VTVKAIPFLNPVLLRVPSPQEAKIMVVPCPSVQPIEEALADCTRNITPIVLYALNQDALSAEQVAELRRAKEILPVPICFVRIPAVMPTASPEPGRRAEREREREREKSPLYKQLLSLGFLSSPAGNCTCGAPSQSPAPGATPQSVLGEAFERLHRLLVPFARQVLHNQQVEAANLLNGVHCRCLDLFINQVRVGPPLGGGSIGTGGLGGITRGPRKPPGRLFSRARPQRKCVM
jgi:receptor-interacting serine/threonine-protein kinase 5